MDMRQLTTLITLAKTLNYQRAADQLQYAPSTLFKHIQLLEQELGVALFAKSGRQLQLTAEGKTFCEHAERILVSYRRAVDSISAKDWQESELTVGGCELNISSNLLDPLSQFCQTYPNAHISMMTSPNTNVPKLIKSDLIDIGFFYMTDEKPLSGMETVRLYQQPAYLMAPRDHPIHERKGLAVEDLAGMPFVYPHSSCCLVSELMAVLRRKDVQLGRTTYLGSIHLVIEHAHAEKAMTLVPHCAVDHFRSMHRMEVIELGEPLVWGWNTIVYRNYESLRPLAKALLQHSIDYAQRLLRRDCVLSAECGG